MTATLATPASPHVLHQLRPPTARPKFAAKSGPLPLALWFESSETATPDAVSDVVSCNRQVGGKICECGRRSK